VILGGGGDGIVAAQAVRDLASAKADIDLIGFLDDSLDKGTLIEGIPVLGVIDAWRELSEEVFFLPALHKVKKMVQRAKRIVALEIPENRWTTLIHPTACVADGIHIGIGSFVASYVTIQPGAHIGNFVSIRAGANIGHHARIHDFGYVGPNATLSGHVSVEKGAHLGPNAVVLDGLNIGRYAVVGIGSAVTKNVSEFTVCMGNPARKITVLGSGTRREE